MREIYIITTSATLASMAMVLAHQGRHGMSVVAMLVAGLVLLMHEDFR